MWVKNVVVDLLMVVLIALATLADVTAAYWVVIIYTPLMLVLKVVALLADSVTGQFGKPRETPPPWIFHLIYALSIALLAFDAKWILAAGWAAIWILSVITEKRSEMRRRGKMRVS